MPQLAYPSRRIALPIGRRHLQPIAFGVRKTCALPRGSLNGLAIGLGQPAEPLFPPTVLFQRPTYRVLVSRRRAPIETAVSRVRMPFAYWAPSGSPLSSLWPTSLPRSLLARPHTRLTHWEHLCPAAALSAQDPIPASSALRAAYSRPTVYPRQDHKVYRSRSSGIYETPTHTRFSTRRHRSP